jgi:folate-binding protein YgfZ
MMAALDLTETMFFDLSARTKLRIRGNDRLRFLNGQITNNISKATATAAIAACVLNAKGKTEAHVFCSSGPDYFSIDSDPELREKLQARLERYLIADDVQIEDVSGQFSIFHVLTENAPVVPAFCRVVSASRLGEKGWDVWVDGSQREEVFEQLTGAHSFGDDASLEVIRIERGIPRWGRELTEEIIPVEANLEESCIDYEKGCYIGQEVISRIKISGQRNKKLSGFTSLHDAPLAAGMKLLSVTEEKKEIGWITSATRSKRLGKEIALGFMKRPFYPDTFKLHAFDPEDPIAARTVRVELADLPFKHPGNRN